jgi:hypothetical protein
VTFWGSSSIPQSEHTRHTIAKVEGPVVDRQLRACRPTSPLDGGDHLVDALDGSGQSFVWL